MVLFRRTYISLAAAVMLPIVAFTAVQTYYLLRDDRREIEDSALDNAEQITTHLDTVVMADISALRVLASSPIIEESDWPALRERILRVMPSYPHWLALTFWDFAGDREIFATDRPPVGAPAAGLRARWSLPRDEPKQAWIGGIAERNGRPVVLLHVPVEREGRRLYVLSAAVEPGFFQAALMQRLPRDVVAAVVDRTGRFIARNIHFEDMVGKPATAYVRDAIASGPRGLYRGVTFEGFENYSAYWTSPSSGWSTHIAIAASRLDAPRLRGVLVVAAGGLAALALAGMLMVIAFRDLADRRRADERLRQAQKMEAIGQLTGGVAHDFNNLLTVILGNLERLRRRLAETPGDVADLRRFADNAHRGAERAAVLTRGLLAFSRQQPLEPRAVDVNRLVGGMSELLDRTLGETIAVEFVRAAGLWRAHVDPNQLENAVINLAVNARDAMPGGGKLTIETANAFLDESYAASNADVAPGQYVAVSITDTGTGMSKEVMARVFEPFFTTKGVGHGTGLGLAQVYGFVKQSGGHVKIYSEPGEGTTVRLYLPRLMADDVPIAEDADTLARAAPAHRFHILAVEDDEEVRAHTTSLLRELGHEVIEAGDGATALALLAENPAVELLFTDVGLPGGMNGRQLADEALRRHPGLKILYTTGYARNAIIHGGRLDPGLSLIIKPFTRAALESKLEEIANAIERPPCLLLVEDEPLIAMMATETLRELGFEVEEAATGTEALNIMRRSGARIGGAIVDFGLPDMKGDALVRELRAMNVRLPVLVASGFSRAELKRRFPDDVAVGFVGKPYTTAELQQGLLALGFKPTPPADPA